MSKVSTNAVRSFIHRTPRRENNTVGTVQNNFSKSCSPHGVSSCTSTPPICVLVTCRKSPFWLDSDDNLSI